MNRRTLLRLAALPLLLSPAAALARGGDDRDPEIRFTPTPQDEADLQQIQAYLNSMHTLKAHFLQVAPDGAMSQGTVWMERPGRMRFEYDPPAPFLLVAGGGVLSFEDRSIKQVSQAPLSFTPLGILLSDNISLTGPVRVVDFHQLPGQYEVRLIRTSAPRDGTLSLLFTTSPLELRQWTIVDAQRRTTRITLYNVEQGVNIDPALFHFVDPRSFQTNGGGG